MAKNKTEATDRSVDDFIAALDTEAKRDDVYELVKIFSRITRHDAIMWGPSIIGFGTHHYNYSWCL